MNIHVLHDRPAADLAGALAEFEMQFTYPLGPGRSFRISHGDDYARFFLAMGTARCFVAEQNGRVLGAVGVAIRPIVTPDGTGRVVAYVGDLKVDPDSRGRFVLPRLARAALEWVRPQVNAAYGIVMDGTRASPTTYTGRIGIPSFMNIANILVLRFPTQDSRKIEDGELWLATIERGEACYRELSRGRFAAAGGFPADRSTFSPQWLVHPQGIACGRLEDTRAVKRLIDSNGNEIVSAHLACAAWESPEAGAALISAARRLAAQRNIPALFTSVCPQDWDSLQNALGPMESVIAPATIYAVGLQTGQSWNINTSEI